MENQREMDSGKKALRAWARSVLNGMSEEEARQSGQRIFESVIASAWYGQARSLFVYVSVGMEPDTRRLICQALEDRKTVYVPKCRKKPLMDAVLLKSMAELAPGMMGIPEPAADGPVAGTVDLAVVPCLSVAPDGARLGHGGGYYDHWLSGHPTKTVCLCHPQLVRSFLPMSALDIRMDAYTAGDGIVKAISSSSR